MTNATILQAQNCFALRSEFISSIKEIFDEKFNITQLDDKKTLQTKLNQTDTIKLKNIVKRLDKGELKFYSDDKVADRLAKKGYKW
ncbi:hypothetical protein [Campylobacter gastrosuis]|uniref:Uncharacterized protein n=1 Tax=Campylobacter gastrosuis TaxID=2974576 RepID=A0ABT7HNT5_9BACT|nr:hypothetical protein [Campylobacter gastrosuis]MDL0088590.1 hypothetical protein [Campylobacter gastrosuis]